MNAFESGRRKNIPAVLVYARHGDEILMIHRNSPDRPEDYHAGKWNGLGGKCEPDESSLQAARRELLEESGLDLPVSAFRALGVLQFPNFKAHKNEDWTVFVFEAQVDAKERDQTLRPSEVELHWIGAKDLLALNLWPGDRHFLPWVLQRRPFIGAFWYEGQELKDHWLQSLA